VGGSKFMTQLGVVVIEQLIKSLHFIVLEAQRQNDIISKETVSHLKDAYGGLSRDRANLISKLNQK
jgi:hypothetical protein